MGNKMFVIGGNSDLTCEVFDSISRKLTYIKNLSLFHIYRVSSKSAVTIGRKIIVFSKYNQIHIYDTLKNQWCLVKNKYDDFISVRRCSKLPAF